MRLLLYRFSLERYLGSEGPQASFFSVQTAAWNKILTGVNMKSKGFDFVDWGCICCCYGETMDHLLIHCEKTQKLQHFVFQSFWVSWVLPKTVFVFYLVGGVGWGITYQTSGIQYRCICCSAYGGNVIVTIVVNMSTNLTH